MSCGTWYQHVWSSGEAPGLGEGDGRLECLPGVLLLALVSVATVACSLASPARSCSTGERWDSPLQQEVVVVGWE